jgi:serine protease Do
LSIGQYGGEPPAISSGIFSSRRRGVKRAFPTDEWLETNAAVNVLNAGGPLVNLAGEVMGIIAAPMSRRAGVVGLGFAVPAEKARRIAADLIAFGQVRRAFLGVQIEPPGLPLADRSVPPGSVMIGSVTPGTPAAEAGLAPGDRIIAIAGRPVIGSEMLQETIEYAPVGENLTLTIERGGLRSDIVVRPQPRPDGPGPGPGVSGFRLPDARRDAVRSRPRVPSTRLAPRQAPPLPRPSADDETPASLDPVPAKPASPPPPAPSLEPPRNSFDQR